MERLAVVARSLVNGRVAHAPQIVKERTLRRADHAPLPEAIDELLSAFLGTYEEADLGCCTLSEDFTELAQLEERDGWIVPKCSSACVASATSRVSWYAR